MMKAWDMDNGDVICNVEVCCSAATTTTASFSVSFLTRNKKKHVVSSSSQTPSDINGVCIAHDGFDSSRSLDGHYTSSGVILFAGEQSRVMAFYVPTLGPAPRLIN